MASGMMAGGYLLDTNVVSELCKPKPDVKVNQFVLGLPATHISVMTLAELQAGIAQSASKGNNVQRLNTWFSKLQGQAVVHDITKDIAIQAGQWRGELKAAGKNQEYPDILIAATTLVQGLQLATRNTGDFEYMANKGLAIYNPWCNQEIR
ncbi:MAG: type II toxin-antitoxin system VapC family toxin [Magnetococcales bacterium]|nr:PIN domain-containing protein [Magnetococcales bacterium]NGZ26044.1 type II toxin-antitoxin system VapC family toxin [Magnetococcales bacterium]